MKLIKKILFTAALAVCLAAAAVGAWNIWAILSEYRAGVSLYERTAERYVSVRETDTEESGEETRSLTAPIEVDFDALLSENPDVVGWLYCEDTVISYPVLRGESNDTWIHHMVDGSYNSAGSIFMDCGNAADFSDANTVIYGHNMKNGSMFGTLDEYKSQSYYEEHPVMWLLTPGKDYRLDILGGCVLASDDEIYGLFDVGEELTERVTDILSRSVFDSGIAWDGEERIVTLSTCSYEYDSARFVLLCRLCGA